MKPPAIGRFFVTSRKMSNYQRKERLQEPTRNGGR